MVPSLRTRLRELVIVVLGSLVAQLGLGPRSSDPFAAGSCWYLRFCSGMPTAFFFPFSFFLFLLIKRIQFALIGDLEAFNIKGTDNLGLCWGRGTVNCSRICSICCVRKEPLVALAWSQHVHLCSSLGLPDVLQPSHSAATPWDSTASRFCS